MLNTAHVILNDKMFIPYFKRTYHLSQPSMMSVNRTEQMTKIKVFRGSKLAKVNIITVLGLLGFTH